MDTLPRNYVYGIIIFTLFVVGGITVLGELGKENPGMIDSDQYLSFNSTFNKYNDVTASVSKLQPNTNSTFGVTGVLDTLIFSGWQVLKLLGSTFSFMNTSFYGIAAFLGVPQLAWVVSLIVLLISAMFIFALYSAIFQRDI